MKRQSAFGFMFMALLLIGGCGSGNTSQFADAVGISAGSGIGDALSGDFTARTEITSNGCEKNTLLETPKDDSTFTSDVTITQEDGVLSFDPVEEVTIRGAINFDGSFQMGGSRLVDRGGLVENVLKIVLVEGEFKEANLFEGNGEVRLEGRVESEEFDCSYKFKLEGIRKDSAAALGE